MLKKLSLSLALLATFATFAMADNPRPRMIEKFDLNKDGKLDDSERTAMKEQFAAERFKKLDTDGNGVLTFAEFKAGAGKMGHHARGNHRHGHRGGDGQGSAQ